MRRSAFVVASAVAVATVVGLSMFVAVPVIDGPPGTDPGTENALEPRGSSDGAVEADVDRELFYPEESDSGFWPYLSVDGSFRKQSPINVVVRGTPEQVVRVLSDSADHDWQETDRDHFDADQEAESGNDSGVDADRTVATAIPWSETTGATRYAYVDPGGGEPGYWITETVQIQDGDYYGHRYHVRLYGSPDPDDQWVVMQAHTEHFDWFTLRHRVDGVDAAQRRVEADLMALPRIDPHEDVRRVYLGYSHHSDSDGWATVVDLRGLSLGVVVLLVSGRPVRRRLRDGVDRYLTGAGGNRVGRALRRLETGHALLPAAILVTVMGVRVLGIALERSVDALSMHAIAALLYPLLALGLPALTYWLASGFDRRTDATVAATLGLGTAIWVDYAYVGIDVLPVAVVLQRTLVVTALGLIAGGAVRGGDDSGRLGVLLAGVALWVVVLAGTLLGHL